MTSLTPDLLLETLTFITAFHHLIPEASGDPLLCSLIDGVAGRTVRAHLWRVCRGGCVRADPTGTSRHRAPACTRTTS